MAGPPRVAGASSMRSAGLSTSGMDGEDRVDGGPEGICVVEVGGAWA